MRSRCSDHTDQWGCVPGCGCLIGTPSGSSPSPPRCLLLICSSSSWWSSRWLRPLCVGLVCEVSSWLFTFLDKLSTSLKTLRGVGGGWGQWCQHRHFFNISINVNNVNKSTPPTVPTLTCQRCAGGQCPRDQGRLRSGLTTDVCSGSKHTHTHTHYKKIWIITTLILNKNNNIKWCA